MPTQPPQKWLSTSALSETCAASTRLHVGKMMQQEQRSKTPVQGCSSSCLGLAGGADPCLQHNQPPPCLRLEAQGLCCLFRVHDTRNATLKAHTDQGSPWAMLEFGS